MWYAISFYYGDSSNGLKPSTHVFFYYLCLSSFIQTSFVIPEDDGYTVYSSTQWPGSGQDAVANILGISDNK